MRAIEFSNTLQYNPNTPKPTTTQGEVIIKTHLAGICNTDIEIVRGYMGFSGILGHEFVGEVVEAPDNSDLVGQRVVGEINANCKQCKTCLAGNPTHCPHRTTLGIDRRNGCMANYFSLPSHLLHLVPETIPNEWAVFTEPLAAACQILEQVHLQPTERVIVVGDGKLGLLIAQVLQLTGCDLTVIGRHAKKLAILQKRGIKTHLAGETLTGQADVIVEATGSPSGFEAARALVRPRGTLVLKSTFHGDVALNLSMLVVDEIKLIGSRCGPFETALRLLEQRLVDVEPLIHATFPLSDGLAAFEKAVEPGVLKVLLSM